MKTTIEHSAGGVVFRLPRATRHAPRALWLICKHSGYHKWVLPKGIAEEGEKPEEAAIREVREETGVRTKIIKKITPDVRYTYTKEIPAERKPIQAGQPEAGWKILVDKTVEFFLMEYVSGDIKNHGWEMEDVKWATKEEAMKLLAFETEKNALKKAEQMLKISRN